MEGADLDELVGASFLQPAGKPLVQLGPLTFGQPGIGDLADQDMLEPERAFAGDRRASLGCDELARGELVERTLDVLAVAGQRAERSAPEDAADHGRAPQQRLLSRG